MPTPMRAIAIAVEEPAPEDDLFIFFIGFILAAVLLMRPLFENLAVFHDEIHLL